MLNLLPPRRRLIPLLAAMSLLVVGTQTPVYTQFTAQIQQALQQLGIWPYDGSYVDGDVPVWSTAVTPSRFVGSSSGGGGNLNAGTVTFSGGDVLDGTLTNRLIDRNGTNAKRWDVANTWTSTISNELFSVDWQTTANSVLVGVRTAATGATRRVFFSAQATSGSDDYAGISISRGGAPIIRAGLYSAAGSVISSASATELFRLGEFTSTATSGTVTPVTVQPTYNQPGAPPTANTDLKINRTETAVGTGPQLLIDAQVGGASKMSLSNNGAMILSGSASAITASDIIVGARLLSNSRVTASITAPTISSGFGTSPSVAASNGTFAFTVNVGTGGTASAGVVGMPAATTGWNCNVVNRTALGAARALQSTTAGLTFQTATSTTSVTFTNVNTATGGAVAWAASDVLAAECMAY